jgi:uncharacterized membrane protein
MRRQLQIFLSGALVIIPIAATIWVIFWIVGLLGQLGEGLLVLLDRQNTLNLTESQRILARWVGVAIVAAGVYLVGLLANVWVFRTLLEWIDRTLSRLPGIKTVYESVRDLLKLFGGDGHSMGYAVLYTPPNSGMRFLGVVTNDHPAGRAQDDDSVIVYLPLGYMIGGPIIYARPQDLQRVDMPVETALKLAATAFVGVGKDAPSAETVLADALPAERDTLKAQDDTKSD